MHFSVVFNKVVLWALKCSAEKYLSETQQMCTFTTVYQFYIYELLKLLAVKPIKQSDGSIVQHNRKQAEIDLS